MTREAGGLVDEAGGPVPGPVGADDGHGGVGAIARPARGTPSAGAGRQWKPRARPAWATNVNIGEGNTPNTIVAAANTTATNAASLC